MEQTGVALWLFLQVEREGTLLAAWDVQGYRQAAFPQKAVVLLTDSQEVDFFSEDNGWDKDAG